MSNFQEDLSKETILAKFLEEKYKNELGWSITRILDKEVQKAGVDFILHQDGLDKRIDEKAQLSYINSTLPTFALEIDYFINGNKKRGWLFDDNKWTDSYAFVFSILVNNTAGSLKEVKDIVSCEVVLVNRLKLLNELANRGLTLKTCIEASAKLRLGADFKEQHNLSGFNFHFSKQLSEQPVNLIVSKRFLEEIGNKYIFEAKSS